MEKIDILIGIIGGGFTINFALLLIICNSLNHHIDSINTSLSSRIEKLDEKITDIDRRLCRLEGAFSSKDCCRIGDERQMKKAE